MHFGRFLLLPILTSVFRDARRSAVKLWVWYHKDTVVKYQLNRPCSSCFMNSPEGDDILLEMVSHIFEPSRGWLIVGYHFSLLNLAFGGLAEYPEQIRQLFKTQSVSEVPLELSQTNRVGLGRWRLKRNQEAADPWLLTQFFWGKAWSSWRWHIYGKKLLPRRIGRER